MKRILFLTLTSLCTFAASNAMEQDPGVQSDEQEDTITVYGLLETNSSKANYQLGKSALTDETTVNEYLSLHSRGSNFTLEIDILVAALSQGHLSMVKKVLDFFETAVNHEDAEKAFPAACSCEDFDTANAMVQELLNRKKFCQAINSIGAAYALSKAFDMHYGYIIMMLLNNSDFAEVVDATQRFKNLINHAYKNNLFTELDVFLRNIPNAEVSAKLSCYAIERAIETGHITYISSLLVQPKITQKLSVQNLTDIGKKVSASEQISDAQKTDITLALESLARSKSWCDIL